MRKIEFTYQGKEWHRVHKNKFWSLWKQKKIQEFGFCSDKMYPVGGYWSCFSSINIDDFVEKYQYNLNHGKTMEDCLKLAENEFSYYNCNYRKTGYNIAYYLPKEVDSKE